MTYDGPLLRAAVGSTTVTATAEQLGVDFTLEYDFSTDSVRVSDRVASQ